MRSADPVHAGLVLLKRATCVGGLMLLAQQGALAAEDPLLGTWELQPRLSRYEAGTMPAKMTVVITAVEGGIHYSSTSRTTAGRPTSVQYTALFDGIPVLVSGDAGLLAPVALKRLDQRTVEATYARPFQPLASSRWRTSADGRRLTIETRAAGAPAASHGNISVYRRVE